MKKWKLIMPTIAFSIVAPISATTSCGCHHEEKDENIQMDFEEDSEEVGPGFFKRNFDIKVNEVYAFDIDMSKISDEVFSGLHQAIEFCALDSSKVDPDALLLNTDKVSVTLNGEELPSSDDSIVPNGPYYQIINGRSIKINRHDGDPEEKWQKSDKLTIKIAWQSNVDKATILCALSH